jgi:hypothetical protein
MNLVLETISEQWRIYAQNVPANSAIGPTAASMGVIEGLESNIDNWVHTISGIGGFVIIILSIMNLYLSLKEKRKSLGAAKANDPKKDSVD